MKRIIGLILVSTMINGFYEGYTPQNWKEDDMIAGIFFQTMFYAPFPGVKAYG